MHCELRNDKDKSVISMAGSFKFEDHPAFRDAYQKALACSTTRIVQLDMSKVEHMDSAALGMTLLCIERCEAVGKQVRITGASGVVRQLLEVAKAAQYCDASR